MKFKEYTSRGKKLIPLEGKLPVVANWTNLHMSESKLSEHTGNFGWVLGEDDLVIDVDPRNGGDVSVKKLFDDLKINLIPTVITPSGGHHYYLSNDKVSKMRKKVKEYPGVDFLTKGSYCVIVGSKTEKGEYTWYDDFTDCFVQTKAPDEIVNLISYEASSNLSDLDAWVNTISPFNNKSKDQMVSMLSKLDPSMTNDDWVKVGMALHGWHNTDGLELWENWSKGGTNYKVGETEKRWRSFEVGGGVTVGTVVHMVKEADFDEKKKKLESFIDKINNSTDRDLELDILPRIRKEVLDDIAVENLAKVVQERLKQLRGVKLPISKVRALVSNVVRFNQNDDSDKPDWCEDWIYVNTHSAYANLNNLKLYKTEAFNLINGKKVPVTENGSKQSASKFVTDSGYIDVVDHMAYLPTLTDKVCVLSGGTKVLNSFNHNSIPRAAESYSEDGLKAIEVVKRHIKFICSTDNNSKIFTQWLAHQVQYPGVKLLWSPVIQSVEGIGKSFFGELLRCCLGDSNVGVVNPTQVLSDFNGWATGVCVNILEELRVAGQNRFSAVNSLKPLITDRIIQINDKGVKQYMTYNTTNYVCFTNFKDALPLTKDDRRWWVIFVPVESIKDIEKIVGEKPEKYLASIFDSVRKHGAEIKKWLAEYQISEEFIEIKQAPMTEFKMGMIATEEAGIEGLNEVRELIQKSTEDKGKKYYNNKVVCPTDLFHDFVKEYSDVFLDSRSKQMILKKLGYSVQHERVWLGGKTRRVWVKHFMTPEEIKQSLEVK